MAEAESAQVRAADEPRQAGAEERAAGPLAEAISIMARLRAPGGCPWDREQSFDTIKRYTLEETYEVFDAIERRAWPELKDELGDLLLQVLFYAQMASEAGHFDIADVAANLNAKLVRRHPHVFPVEGKLADATDPEAVLRNWEQIKRGEKLAAAAGKKTRIGHGCDSALHAGDDGGAQAGFEGGEGGLRLAGCGGALREAAGRDCGIESRVGKEFEERTSGAEAQFLGSDCWHG